MSVHIQAGDSLAAAPETVKGTPVAVKELDFEYLTAKSKVSFEGKSQNFQNTNVNIRMRKDSLIWLSVTAVGLEVARGIITPDSIMFMDKVHKDYFIFTYADLSKKYNFDLNFQLLQSMIIGSMPFPASENDLFLKENEFFVLKQNKDRLELNNYVAENNLKLTRLEATEVPTKNTFLLDYSDFKDVSGFLFPFSSMINLSVNKDQQVNQTRVEIRHSKVELAGQNPGFPFSLPSSYKRKK